MNSGLSYEILVCGTVAIDTIGRSTAPAGRHNVKLDTLLEHPGGCGSNLIYNLAGLGRRTAMHAFVGETDGASLIGRLAHPAADLTGVHQVPGEQTARAFIFTDSRGDQFTAFKPMAVPDDVYSEALQRTIARVRPRITIVAPDEPEKMILASTLAASAGSQVICCPGQYAELLSAADANALAAGADTFIVNKAEYDALEPVVGSPAIHWVATDGGADVVYRQDTERVSARPPDQPVVDPTGCGDAFAAGYVDSLLDQAPPKTRLLAGIALAQRCLAQAGAQNHRF